MNLSEIRAKVRSLTGIALPDLVTDADIDAFVNEVYTDICRQQAWPFLAATSTEHYEPEEWDYDFGGTLPPNLRDITTVSYFGAFGVRGILEATSSRGMLEAGAFPGAERGLPRLYTTDPAGRHLKLFPVPDRDLVFTVDYIATPTPLIGTTDTPVFRSEYHDAVAYGAAALVLAREGDPSDRIGTYTSRMADIVAGMVRDYRMRTDTGRLILASRRPGVRSRRTRGGGLGGGR